MNSIVENINQQKQQDMNACYTIVLCNMKSAYWGGNIGREGRVSTKPLQLQGFPEGDSLSEVSKPEIVSNWTICVWYANTDARTARRRRWNRDELR